MKYTKNFQEFLNKSLSNILEFYYPTLKLTFKERKASINK